MCRYRDLTVDIGLLFVMCCTGLSVGGEGQGGAVHDRGEGRSRHLRQVPSREEDTADAHGAVRGARHQPITGQPSPTGRAAGRLVQRRAAAGVCRRSAHRGTSQPQASLIAEMWGTIKCRI